MPKTPKKPTWPIRLDRWMIDAAITEAQKSPFDVSPTKVLRTIIREGLQARGYTKERE